MVITLYNLTCVALTLDGLQVAKHRRLQKEMRNIFLRVICTMAASLCCRPGEKLAVDAASSSITHRHIQYFGNKGICLLLHQREAAPTYGSCLSWLIMWPEFMDGLRINIFCRKQDFVRLVRTSEHMGRERERKAPSSRLAVDVIYHH